MTTFKDYLRDIHLTDKIEQDFEEWLFGLEQNSDIMGELFMEYIAKIGNTRKIGKLAYIILNNQ